MGEFGVQPPKEKRLVAVIGGRSHKRAFCTKTKYTAAPLSRETSLRGSIYIRACELVSALQEAVDPGLISAPVINDVALMC